MSRIHPECADSEPPDRSVAADVLLLTATPVESKVTLQAFAAATQHKAVPQSLDDRIYFDLGTVNGARVCLTQSEMGAGGLGATLQTTHKGITALQPALCRRGDDHFVRLC